MTGSEGGRRSTDRGAGDRDRSWVGGVIGPGTLGGPKAGAAALSIASNSLLVALKIIAGVITGSLAILTEALHSAVDLLASVVAFVSVRKADQPADYDHPYGHEKVEHLAALIEGMLILVGAGIIVFESARRLNDNGEIEQLGFGIAVVAFALVANVIVSAYLGRTARRYGSPALEGDAAHLRADALTSAGVLVGLVVVQITGAVWLDSVIALGVAAAIVVAGLRILSRSGRVLVDEAPAHELDLVEQAIATERPPEVVGYHKLRARRAGARRHVDLHLQFEAGTTLEAAHGIGHRLQAAIEAALGDADVLIHLEPEGSVRDHGDAADELFRSG
ncbi:MAG: cation diffusion facilitator family transporter [Solirubrobacterales bacterium]